jgi:hypothetical protein
VKESEIFLFSYFFNNQIWLKFIMVDHIFSATSHVWKEKTMLHSNFHYISPFNCIHNHLIGLQDNALIERKVMSQLWITKRYHLSLFYMGTYVLLKFGTKLILSLHLKCSFEMFHLQISNLIGALQQKVLHVHATRNIKSFSFSLPYYYLNILYDNKPIERDADLRVHCH